MLELSKNIPLNTGFEMDGYWVWCGSVIKGGDNRYHMFASRWSKALPMHPGWLLASEVVRASSDTALGPFKFEETVLPARGAEYWDGRATHNPHIKKHGDTYILFYMGSTNPFPDSDPSDITLNSPEVIVARSNKRIGIATAKSINGPWTRLDRPVLNTRPNMFDSFLVSNPAPCIHEDGSCLLIYKARAYVGTAHGNMTFGVAKSDCITGGVFTPLCDKPIFGIDKNMEDPYIWHKGGKYHMIAKDMDGKICGERHAGVYCYSEDGIKWESDGFKAYSKVLTFENGTTITMGNLERSFILFEDGKMTTAYFAAADGTGGFHNATKTWNIAIPLIQK